MLSRAALLSTVAALAMPSLAFAQPASGPYVSLSGGVNLVPDTLLIDAVSPGVRFLNLNKPNTYKDGFAITAAAGYRLTPMIRTELEFSYRNNKPDNFILTNAYSFGTAKYSGTENKYSFMLNTYVDIANFWGVTPYVGVGLGATLFDWDGVARKSLANPYFAGNSVNPGQLSDITNTAQEAVMRFTYQAIGGASYAIPGTSGLSLTAEYRFLAMPETVKIKDRLTAVPTTPPANGPGFTSSGSGYSRYSSQENHTFLVGLRYEFGAAPVAPVTAAVAPVAPPAAARTYLVFFDWDRADLTDRARQVVGDAVQGAKRVSNTRIEVAGHADRSGTPAYNQALSQRRAESVGAELVRQGINRSDIIVTAFGESRPLVPTADGLREPQNRRVEIVLK
ncbi:MAG: OmpA family protein [Paracraurococcus sp.]